MAKEVNCPKCPRKVYIRKGKYENGYFIGDVEKGIGKYHRETCPSGNFKDTDILQSFNNDILSNKYLDIEYRGNFNTSLIYGITERLATVYNKNFSSLIGGKKIYLIKYNNIDFIYKIRKFSNEFRQTGYLPYIVDSDEEEDLIFAKNFNHKKQFLNELEYNKFYLFERIINTHKEINSYYLYEYSPKEITDDNVIKVIYELLANEMDYGVVSKLLSSQNAIFNSKLTSFEELQEILKLKQQIGEAGEMFVLHKEKRELKDAGLEKYANKVKKESKTNVSAGYDILSFDNEGQPKFIEVKTSNLMNNHFYMSANEWEKAKRYGKDYYIYVVILKPKPELVRVFRDPTNEDSSFIKDVNSYKIRFI